MKDTLSISLARKMKQLLDGGRVPSSLFPFSIASELLDEEVLVLNSRGTKRSYLLRDEQGLLTYLAQRYNMNGNLEEWIAIASGLKETKRSEQVQVTGNSKLRKTRAFKGFLLKSYSPIGATLRGEEFLINLPKGVSLFIEDYESFRIPKNVVVIGIENGENFQHIHGLRYLFEGMNVLFVSRYPQSKDLRTWLQQIPNRYLHFGDFDLAGVNIFLTEFYAYLGERAEFFVPTDIEERLNKGNQTLYDTQYAKYKTMELADERLTFLVQLIHQCRRGYEQEGYIRQEESIH